MNLDETTDNILRRARQREAELKKLESELHGNENLAPVRKETPKKSILSPIQSPLKPISSMNRSEDENSSPQKAERKSRFAKLAAEFDEFECDLKPHNLTKENVVKGPQKRISMGGETRASVLFTPGYVPQPTERRSIASKQDKLTPEKKPSLSTTIFEEEPKSPKTLGLSFWANATSETSLTDSGPLESTSINFDLPNKMPGGIRNCPIKSVSSLSIVSVTGIPKPYVSPILAPQMHSPVSFTPPKVDDIPFADETKLNRDYDKGVLFSYTPKKEAITIAASYKNTPSPLAKESSPLRESPKKRVSYQAAVRSPILTYKAKSPGKIDEKAWSDESIPNRDTTTSNDDTNDETKESLDQTRPPVGNLRAILKKFEENSNANIVPAPKKPLRHITTQIPSIFGSAPSKPVALPIKLPVNTHTPEIVNRHPSESISASADAKPRINPASSTRNSIKALRNRWEVSSATGTPMDPDSSRSDEILDAAAKMAQKSTVKRNFEVKKLTFGEIIGKGSGQSSKPKDLELKPPSSKSPRLEQVNYFGKVVEKDESVIIEEEMLEPEPESTEPETSDTSDRPESVTSDVIIGHWLKKPNESMEMSPNKTAGSQKSPQKCIDEAFDFIHDQPDASGITTPKNFSPMKQITPKKSFSDDPGNKQSSSLLNDITDDYQRYQPTTPKTPRTPTAYSDVLEPGTPGSALAHTISFYRKQRSAQKGDGYENKSFMSQTSDSVMKKPHSSLEFADESLEDRLKQIEEAIMIQQDQISQLSHALSFCRQNVMFHGGAEEVDAQRVLLIATERRRALIFERDRLCNLKKLPPLGPLGTVTLANIEVQLHPNFIHTYTQQSESAKPYLYHFIVLIKHREQVLHTQLITSKHGVKNGFVEFPNYIQLHNLPPDFTCSVEVFCLKINAQGPIGGGGSTKLKKTSTWKKILASPYKSGHSYNPRTIQHNIIDSGFQKAGYFLMNRAHVLDKARSFRLTDVVQPLGGTIRMDLKCCAETFGSVAHRGFLSLYQTVDSMGSWTRFWCALFEGCMRFWRYPEDEENKKPLVTLRMDDFISAIKAVPPTVASFQFSMEGHIRIHKDKNSFEDIKLLLASDTKESMDEWLEAMNESIVDATTWSTPFHDVDF